MRRESDRERRERLDNEERAKFRRNAAKEMVRQDVIAHQNRNKTDADRKGDADFEDVMTGKNATLNEREAFRGALTAALIDKMTNNEDAMRYAQDRDADFVERWTGTKSSKKKSTERK